MFIPLYNKTDYKFLNIMLPFENKTCMKYWVSIPPYYKTDLSLITYFLTNLPFENITAWKSWDVGSPPPPLMQFWFIYEPHFHKERMSQLLNTILWRLSTSSLLNPSLQGKKYTGSGQKSPRNAPQKPPKVIKEPPKVIKEPPKLHRVQCTTKIKSVIFMQASLKSSPPPPAPPPPIF